MDEQNMTIEWTENGVEITMRLVQINERGISIRFRIRGKGPTCNAALKDITTRIGGYEDCGFRFRTA